MSEIHPLEASARVGAEQSAAGDFGLVLRERRPGSFVEVALWDISPATVKAVLKPTGVKAPPEACRLVSGRGGAVLFAGPGRYFAVAEDTGLAEKIAAAMPGGAGAVVDLTHGRVGIRIEGGDAETLLQKGATLDLDLRAFPASATATVGIHHMSVTLVRVDEDVFDLFAMSSFADAIWHWVCDSAVEYGWRVEAPVA